VKITPFGLEKPQGERTFRIKEFDKEGKFQIILHATNTFLNKTAVQGITILEISKENLKVNPQEYSVPKSQTNPEKPTQEFSKRWFVFLMLLIIAAIAIYFSEKA
jgi:hypothetical protein